MARQVLILMMALFFLAPGAARAGVPECLTRIIGDRTIDGRPGPKDRPTVVRVGMNLTAVQEIDAVQQTFFADFYLTLHWMDSRLAYEPSEVGVDVCSFSPEDVWFEQRILWNPFLEQANLRDEVRRGVEDFSIHPDGTCRYTTRLAGHFVNAFDVSRFPFDRHELEIWTESGRIFRDAVLFLPAETSMNLLVLPDWTVTGVRSDEVEAVYPEEPSYSRHRFIIGVDRNSGYYLWKVFLPLVLIVILSWTVLWIRQEEIEAQMQISITAVLAVIAFNYVIAGDLPKVSYLTVIDIWILVSYFFVFLGTIESVAGHYFDRIGLSRQFESIEKRLRWLMPLAYAVSMGAGTLLA